MGLPVTRTPTSISEGINFMQLFPPCILHSYVGMFCLVFFHFWFGAYKRQGYLESSWTHRWSILLEHALPQSDLHTCGQCGGYCMKFWKLVRSMRSHAAFDYLWRHLDYGNVFRILHSYTVCQIHSHPSARGFDIAYWGNWCFDQSNPHLAPL